MFRSFALMALASTAAAGVTQSEMGNQLKTAAMSVISHVEAAQGHSLLAPFGKGHLVSRRQGEDDDDDECPEMGPAMQGVAGDAFRTFYTECGAFMGSFGQSMSSNEGANAVCTDPCLATILGIYSAAAPALPDSDGCRQMKTMFAMMPRLIGGVICSRNHLGWRCGAVFGNLATVGGEAVAGSGAGSGQLDGSGSDPTTMFGIMLTPAQRTSLRGICGQFEAAGCCMGTLVSVLTTPAFRSMMGGGDTFPVAAFEAGIAAIKTTCTSLGRSATHIGAPPCQIASVRNGGIAAGTIALVRRVARLVLTFPGDLGTASPAFKARIVDRVTTELNTLLGDGAVTGVVLSSGSILATASFADDVSETDVEAASSSAGVTELGVQADDGSTITVSAVTVTSASDSSGDSAASAVVPGVLAIVAAAATAGCML